MDTDKLMKVKELKETSDLSEANKYLSEGWRLIATYTACPFAGEPDSLEMVYCLGKVD